MRTDLLPSSPADDLPRTGAEARSEGRFAHRPALDGLRGLAVAGVLAFHLGAPWARGGYLGVSAFFTLSGFLITTLLLREHRDTGSVSLRHFWLRRARRLMPVALLGIALASAYALVAADAAVSARLPADIVAALAYVANWRFLLSDLSYAELFSGDSPLQHYWSLAIEEQFYLLLPLLALLLLGRRSASSLEGQHLRRFTTVLVLALLVSIIASLLTGGDRAYYGTDTRLAELLVGVLLAVWHHRSDVRLSSSRRSRNLAGALALAGMLATWTLVDVGTPELHPWLLLVHATLTALVIASVLDASPTSRLLSSRPLTELGRISYGVYVFHWPIFLWLTPGRTGLDGTPLAVIRVGLAVALAAAVHRLLEEPIRHWRVSRRAWAATVAVAAISVPLTAAAFTLDRDPAVDFDVATALQEQLGELDERPETSASAPADTGETVLPRPARVSVFGDSTALMFLPGLAEWGAATEELTLAQGFTGLGCGLGRGGSIDRPHVGVSPLPQECIFDVVWPPVLADAQPDVALVGIGLWDTIDRRLEGDDQWRTIGDPVYDEYLRGEIRDATDLLAAHADRVVWVLQPPPVRGTQAAIDVSAQRIGALNQVVLDALSGRDDVGFVDLAAWISARGGDPLLLRPDGTHLTEETSIDAAVWLAPAVLEAARTSRVVGPGDVTAVPVPSPAAEG